jgi:glucose-6-phosphate isomerase
VIKKSLFLKYQLQNKYLKKNTIINLSKKFDHIFSDVIEDINNPKKTLNVLNKIKMNFKQKELDRFKNFNKIALIGMGGSILGAEAIHSFLETNIKKKMFFFNDLDEKKILNFKKKENMSKILFIII